MGFILKLLGGASGGWILAGALVAAGLFGAAGGSWTAHKMDAAPIAEARQHQAEAQAMTQQCVASHETDRANANAGAVADLNKSIADAAAASAQLAARQAAADQSTKAFMEKLSHVPQTSVCGTSDAERAYRDGVRAQAGPAATP